ncbi:MAG TPA: MraY family glycosyltransferase [Alphaproteobacteria bacterium]
MTVLFYAALALGLAGLSAAVAHELARRAVFVDVPNARSSHAKPTPRGGGLGILIAFSAGLGVLAVSNAAMLAAPVYAGFALGTLVAGLAGLVDDLRPQSFTIKLGAQVVAAVIAMTSGLVIETLYVPGIGPVDLGVMGPVLTLVWLVGLTNAYNFMDGLDGLAGGTAVLAATFVALCALTIGNGTVAVLALLLAAASAGFLALNFPPARIFMGDVGSQFLGFAFAAIGILLASGDASGTVMLIVPLLLFHFLFDTIFTVVRRIRRGEDPFTAHRGHLYQLLNRAGFGHRQVTFLQCAMVVLQGLGALWMTAVSEPHRWLIFLPFLALQIIYAAGTLRLFSSRR